MVHYRQMLHRLRDRGLEFVTFGTFIHQGVMEGRYVLSRHDVDVRLQPAAELWKVESELGVHSTWFVRTRATGYSLDQPDFREWMSQLIASGCEIGLHEEISHFASGPADLVEGIAQERCRLEDLLGIPVLGVSTHLPRLSQLTLTEEMAKRAGFQYDAGSPRFNPAEITFFSDANRTWKSLKQRYQQTPGCPCSSEAAPIYLLTHPIWWSELDQDVSEIVQYLVAGK